MTTHRGVFKRDWIVAVGGAIKEGEGERIYSPSPRAVKRRVQAVDGRMIDGEKKTM